MKVIGPAFALVALLFASTGCGLFQSADSPQPPPPERTTLRVGVATPIDTAPLRIAAASGKFREAGLNVELVDLGTDDGVAKLTSGRVDVTFASDVSLFRAAAAGTALQLQGEAYTSGDNTIALVTLPGSDYREPTSKKSPKIAVDRTDDVGALTARSVLATAGVDPAKVRLQASPFSQMPEVLQSGGADAAVMVEPFITQAEKELGAQILADGSSGATLDFPASGYAATGAFAAANPRTLAAFRRVLTQAQLAAADPATVRDALPSFSDIDATTAALISLGSYPTTLSATRLQRVADLMHSSGQIPNRLDVQAMLPVENQP
ncbi:ABC transporter substrate-binding protein [Amycolatopsis jiangsuensis]|uniref:NitT/TauT family transport system substrate-binding protein n=1 Tax=Amycolatopsis jiangsuensis TaxID=1181879 RepID=A0A840J3R4_9PSEU|nr:ABC transporter substrate-binding protein [Amycolatopsis jiangsuensis]MBB4687954.1 NitT/TauT family transport system substrate-binding protein [Amycolatopsis jiangsuensis]